MFPAEAALPFVIGLHALPFFLSFRIAQMTSFSLVIGGVAAFSFVIGGVSALSLVIAGVAALSLVIAGVAALPFLTSPLGLSVSLNVSVNFSLLGPRRWCRK